MRRGPARPKNRKKKRLLFDVFRRSAAFFCYSATSMAIISAKPSTTLMTPAASSPSTAWGIISWAVINNYTFFKIHLSIVISKCIYS